MPQIFTWNSDAWGYGSGTTSLYQSHPWVLVLLPDGKALGVLADTTRRCEVEYIFYLFHIGANLLAFSAVIDMSSIGRSAGGVHNKVLCFSFIPSHNIRSI